MIDTEILIRTIDEFLIELGTSGLIDARKARDQLIDLRLILMNEAVKEAPNVPIS